MQGDLLIAFGIAVFMLGLTTGSMVSDWAAARLKQDMEDDIE